MKLYCVRHGHAALTPDHQGERPLTEQGLIEVGRVASYLAMRGMHVSHVMHSNKQRAVRTAQMLAAKISTAQHLEETDLLAPSCSVDALVEQVQTWNDDTMLVGHMPYMSQLISALVVGDDAFNIVRFTPGTIVCVERYEGAHWILNWVLRPDLLPDDL
jgi:phosphohistidine phosphatase